MGKTMDAEVILLKLSMTLSCHCFVLLSGTSAQPAIVRLVEPNSRAASSLFCYHCGNI
jgi:hypothetical protein